MSDPAASGRATGHRLSPLLTVLLAAAAGISVANLYYAQPLLVQIGHTFHESYAHTGMLVTFTQLGYASGLLWLTPLGDAFPKRSLITWLCSFCVLALVAVAMATSLPWLFAASFALGMVTVVPQVIVPLTADLAGDGSRGRALGTVMGGLLLGILAARTFSGVIGALMGWRAVYLIAAALMAGLAAVMRWRLPATAAQAAMPYRQLVRSLWDLAREQPLLRASGIIGGSMFGAFSVLWTVLAFRLAAAPYHFGSAIVGLFGLVGIAGALGAPLAGSIADRRGPRFMIGIGIVVTAAAYGLMWLGVTILPVLVLGVLALDFGVQVTQISNQTRIYALVPQARSRVNSVYMICYVLGGSVGSALANIAYGAFNWTGACLAAFALILTAAITHWKTAARPAA